MPRGLNQTPATLGGKTIIEQVLRNAEAGHFELGYTVLVPCIFYLYLHPDDYARLSGIFPYIREDARRALQDGISQLNHASSRNRTFRSHKPEPKEYKIAGFDFVFEFFSDDDGTVPPGDVEIHSELAEKPRPGFHGVRTTLINREPSVRTGHLEGPPDARAPSPSAPATSHGAPQERERGASERIYAEIRYEDDSGPQIFFITQNEISIGRGGDGRIVDLALYSDEEISREHLRLRRDPARNHFFIVDCSMNGTAVDGRKLVRDIEETLPAKATIALAEHLEMQFEQRS